MNWLYVLATIYTVELLARLLGIDWVSRSIRDHNKRIEKLENK